MKKFISMALATIMAMSLACTAFASSSSTTSSGNEKLTRSGTFTGFYNQPTINVTIPTSGTGVVALNPYKLKFTQNGFVSRDSIAFVPQVITNESNVGVDISVVVTGKPTNITLEKTSVKNAETGADLKTTKSAWMYVWFSEAAVDSETTGTGEDAVTTNTYYGKWDAEFATLMAGDGEESDSTDETEAAAVAPTFSGEGLDAVLIQSTASKDTKVLTLAEPTFVTTGTGDEAVTTCTPTYGIFKIDGNIVSRPATAYDSKDKVDVTIAWTIIPLVAQDPDAAETAEEGEGG